MIFWDDLELIPDVTASWDDAMAAWNRINKRLKSHRLTFLSDLFLRACPLLRTDALDTPY